jgi:ABC-type glycerol-3-phosphate transport system substrate-binding protein
MKRALALLAAVVLAGCGTSATPVPPAPSPAPSAATSAAPAASAAPSATPAAAASPQGDPNAPITVWIDQPRQPAIDAYIKAHPDKASLIKAVIVDREQFPSKVLLFNNTGSGWPDVVFAEPRLVARVSDAAHLFPLDLTGLIPADQLANYSAMNNCTFDGKVYCVRNDLAPMVTYYNKPLMDQFGYTVPTTFEEMQALSDKVAADHPGYLLGTFGDGWSFLSFFEASGCPTHSIVDAGTLKIDVTDPACVRAANLVDHMIANKTLWNTDYFDASMVKQANENKLLMMVAPVWAALGTFKGTYYTDKTTPNQASHQLGVAPPLKWAADATAQTAAMGGAAWTVSQHTQNPALAVDLVEWVTQNADFWKGTTNFPAFKPLQPLFQTAVSSDPIFASDPFPAMSTAADQISQLDNWPRFDLIAPLNTVVKDAYSKKQTILATLPEVVSAFTPLAQADGYNVVGK